MAANNMECPQCHFDNPPTAARCVKCDTPFDLEATMAATPSANLSRSAESVPKDWSRPSDPAAAFGPALSSGSVLGTRYEIVQLLGQGGMGAVYKARDRELDRLVALKVIRPEMAVNPEVLRRFKQELILARQVTHRNVIRIFDLGEADGIKFITMEYIEGRDLKSLMTEKGKLSFEETARIIEQVCLALEAAHAEGVVHRDLKPQNIMLDKQGKAAVMDFGIARSMESDGMTQTGVLVGTPDYMSPEQVMGEHVDARSDLFTLGVILYELLTGSPPYKADTTQAAMFKRTREVPRPPIEADPTVPQFLSDVAAKCLQIDSALRYQSAREILQDLEAWRGGATRGHPTATVRRPAVPSAPLSGLARFKSSSKWLASALAALIAVGLFAVIKKPGFHSAAKPEQPAQTAIALAILPFRNASGDPSLDWLGSSLADMLSTDVGESAHLHPVSSDRLRQVLHDLQITPDATSDAATLRRITSMMSADTVVSGQYAKFGDQIRIDATLRDMKQGRAVNLKSQAPNEKDLLSAVDQLAQTIRENLALSPQMVNELKAQSFKPSSKSLAAIRLYSEGIQLARQGNNLEALKRFQASTKEDPEFALAYVKLSQTYANLGHDDEAEQYSRKAVDLDEHLPVWEKYYIAANNFRIERDYPKAIESYEMLANASPDDTDTQFALARLYEDTDAFDKARDHYSKVLAADPKHVDALLASGRVELKSGNPQSGLEYLNRGLTLAIQLGNDEEKAAFLQAIGAAYGELNKQDEAQRYYQQSLEIKRRLGDKRGIAASLEAIAQIKEGQGKSEEAWKDYGEALQLRREIGDKIGTGDILMDMGTFKHDRAQYDEALKFFKESLQIERELGNESNQGMCLNNIGSCYFFKGDYENALTYFQQALELREKSKVPEDIVLTVHNLAETNAKSGQYDKALSFYLRALNLYRTAGDKRGAAMETYSMGTLFGYQGRFGSAINAKQEALKTFQDLKDHTYWMSEILSGYGMALADGGRVDEAQKSLDSALALARELKNDGSIAQVLNYQGECSFYRSDFNSAMKLYQQALQFALRSKEQDKVLLSKFNLAKVTLKQGRVGEATTAFRKLASEADVLGLKYLSSVSSVYSAESLLNAKDYEHARKELEQTAPKAQKMELRAVLAQDQYLLAAVFRLTGHMTEAISHYREALRYLDEIRKDTGNDTFLQRSDLNPIYIESNRWVQGQKE